MFDRENVKTENLLFLYFYENTFLTRFLAYKTKKADETPFTRPIDLFFLDRGFYLVF